MKTISYKLALIFIASCLLSSGCQSMQSEPAQFDEEIALSYLETQLSFGYRYPGSEGHTQTIDWLQQELQNNNWKVTLYEYPYYDLVITNVVAHRDGTAPHILLGAHYDTRITADQDKDQPQTPVMGANDGASGVAVLLELSRVLPQSISNEISLAFFDFEDQGNIGQYQWIAGSNALANDPIFALPDQVIIVDMIGDADLNIYMDHNSDEVLSQEIWAAAADLDYQSFLIPETKYSMYDDHVPFKEKGIPAIDIIDFDYPYWHTTQDVAENISSKSLGIIGETLLYWLSKSIN
ncbi:MAG: M28 family peptidase [Anaerolineaceae bacterium]|nr:M28 family peptidase [Anaerolineaceae bacterium]